MTDSPEESRGDITLLIESSDETLVNDVNDQFGEDNVSGSSNFIGGVSIAVFLVASIKSLQPVVKTILDFLARRKGRYDDARIVYDGRKIDLKGYSADEAEKILNHPVFDKLRE